ncbi:MAG: hypothetical protein LC122_06725, partial [Chitinophagales bacterium]|nr:hypothetical protein [Chitinophagales bacterium]
FNAFEWVIPTAFGVLILKPYFEGFLSEAGKDHYVLLKKFIGDFLEKGKEYNFSVIAAKQSSEKLSQKYNKSFSVSIEMQTKNDRTIKVLYDNSISVEEWKNASEEILNIFDDHYKNYPNDELTSKIKQFDNKPHRKLYITVDKFPQKYILKDDTEMMIEFKNQ